MTLKYQAPVVRVGDCGKAYYYGESATTKAQVGDAALEAKGAAVAGDTIYINASADVDDLLIRQGVNWSAALGVTVKRPSGSLFSDDSTGPVQFQVGGYGDWIAGDGNAVFYFRQNGTNVGLAGRNILAVGEGIGLYIADHAKVTASFAEIRSELYDAVIYGSSQDGYLDARILKTDANDPDSNALEIAGDGGTLHVRAQILQSVVNAIWKNTESSTGLRLDVQRIDGTLALNGGSIYVNGVLTT
jgi:hypothetical protein